MYRTVLGVVALLVIVFAGCSSATDSPPSEGSIFITTTDSAGRILTDVEVHLVYTNQARVTDTLPTDCAGFELFPNPSAFATAIRFPLPVSAAVAIELWNHKRTVKLTTIFEQQLDAKDHEVLYQKDDYEFPNLPLRTGFYWIVLKSNGVETCAMPLLHINFNGEGPPHFVTGSKGTIIMKYEDFPIGYRLVRTENNGDKAELWKIGENFDVILKKPGFKTARASVYFVKSSVNGYTFRLFVE